MRGIISTAGYLPYWRLDRAAIAAFHGSAPGRGTRTAASYDEDSTTLAVEAGRLALRGAPSVTIDDLWLATSSPTYHEKSNASLAHAALRLDPAAGAYDAAAAVRSGAGALRAAVRGVGTTLVIAGDVRTGLPNSADERDGGDAGAAIVVGEDSDAAPVIAEYLGGAAATREFLDRWRTPGDVRTKSWDEKFSQRHYVDLGTAALDAGLKDAGVTPEDVAAFVTSSLSPRATKALVAKSGIAPDAVRSTAAIGQCGAADVGLALAGAVESASPGEVIVVLSLADGADVSVFRATDAIARWNPVRSVDDQLAVGNDALPYSKYLVWRQTMTVEPPRRPEPARVSGSAAGRSIDWKYGFVASRDRTSGAVHMPPARVSFDGGAVDDMEALPMADAVGNVVTFTIDKLSYSLSPPVIFAVVDFEGGGRLPVEICDVTPDELSVGDTVEMTFRRLNTADGIANYFWKARPVRGGN